MPRQAIRSPQRTKALTLCKSVPTQTRLPTSGGVGPACQGAGCSLTAGSADPSTGGNASGPERPVLWETDDCRQLVTVLREETGIVQLLTNEVGQGLGLLGRAFPGKLASDTGLREAPEETHYTLEHSCDNDLGSRRRPLLPLEPRFPAGHS